MASSDLMLHLIRGEETRIDPTTMGKGKRYMGTWEPATASRPNPNEPSPRGE